MHALRCTVDIQCKQDERKEPRTHMLAHMHARAHDRDRVGWKVAGPGSVVVVQPMPFLASKDKGNGVTGVSNLEPMMKLPKAALVLGDASVQYSTEVARRGLRKDSCLLFTVAFAGVALIASISLTGFLMAHFTSNVFTAQGFMTNMLASVSGKLEESVDPVDDHLMMSLTRIRPFSVDSWESISVLTEWRLGEGNKTLKNCETVWVCGVVRFAKKKKVSTMEKYT